MEELPPLDPRNIVKNFKNAWFWEMAAEPIDDATDQVDTVSLDTNVGASAFLSFGISLANLRPDRQIGLVPCAKGQTGLTTHWMRDLSRSTLYGSMIARTVQAAKSGETKGIIWYGGEYETKFEALASNYAADWLSWFQQVRADLELPDLKAVVTILGPDQQMAKRPYWGAVQAQIASLHGALNGSVTAVSASDLTVKPNEPMHLNTASLVTLGQRYAAAMHVML